jgi:hypothetical protein
MFLGTVPSVDVYHLNDSSLEIIKSAAQRRDAVMRMRRRGNGGMG